MRKFLIVLAISGIIFGLCPVAASAASYDLIGPNPLSYQITAGRDESFKYFGSYWYEYIEDSEGYEVLDRSYGPYGFPGISYSDRLSDLSWVVGSDWSSFYPYTNEVFSPSTNVDQLLSMYYGGSSSRSNSLLFGQFVYEGLILPVTGTYLKVSLSFQGFLYNVPSELRNYLNTDYFCYLCDTRALPGSTDQYSIPRLTASSVVVTDLGGGYNRYDYYFNYQNIPDGTFSSDNVCLAVRIPVYIPNNSTYNSSSCFYMSAELPQSYEILTIGGYDQELASIENAIITSNQNLIDLYTQQSESDRVHVIQGQQSNDKLDQGIKDYQSAAVSVGALKDDYTPPPMQSLVNDNLSVVDTSYVKDFFGNGYILSAVGLVFSFCIIRLILYGTKEG